MNHSEHEKLHEISERSQACGEFLEWLQGQGYTICRRHEHDDSCFEDDVFDPPRRSERRCCCGMRENEYFPSMLSIERLLATYFGIDLVKLDDEKRAMLREVQEQNLRESR